MQNDIDLFKAASAQQQQETNWRKNNPDIIHDLIAHWDMLETTSKTHAFTLGSMQVKRDDLLKNWNKKTSNAQNIVKNNIQNYGALRTA